MNRLSICRHGCFLERFRQRRMRMTRSSHIFRASSVFNSQNSFGNHLTRVGSHNMYSQDPISFCVCEKFDHPLRLEIRLGTRVGGKGKCSDLVFYPLFLELRLVLAYPGNFGMRVHYRWDGVVVYVPVPLCDVLDRCYGFFFCFMGQHGAEGAVTYYANVGMFGAVLLVDYKATFVVDFQTDIFKAKAGSVGPTADSYENDVCV